MSDQGANYSDLANVLALISQKRADAAMQQRMSGGDPQHAMGGGGSFGVQEAYNNAMAKMWQYYSGLGLQQNTLGRAPQILDNQKNLQWMQSALADPSGIGSGYSGGGMLHTPQAAADAAAIKAQREHDEKYQQALQNHYDRLGQQVGMNSNTGMPNGIDPRTGQPYYNGGNGLVPGALSQLAQNPKHAEDLVAYFAAGGNGGAPGGAYQYNGNQGFSAQLPPGAPLYPGFIPADGRGGVVDENGSWQQDQMQAYPRGNDNGG